MPYTDINTLLPGGSPTTGDSVPASWFQAVRDDLELVAPWGQWTAFTPSVLFGATAASISSNESRWMRIGRLIIAEYAFRLSSLNAGTGTMLVSRPVAGRSFTLVNSYTACLGIGGLIDVSSGALYSAFVHANVATDIVFRTSASPSVGFTNSAPITIAVGGSGTGDEFYAKIMYEAAADA